MEPPQPNHEINIIQTLLEQRQPVRPAWLNVDAGDDAAVVDGRDCVTTDCLVEGVHWDSKLSPEDVGFKCVAVSVSDCLAMGARPRWMVLSLALGRSHSTEWVSQFALGIMAASRQFGVRLVGGDTVRTPNGHMVSVTMSGRCLSVPLSRSGAVPGHQLWVTGTLGLAASAYADGSTHPLALAQLRRPAVPFAFALALARHQIPSAAMDLSDGLSSDLPRLCTSSGVGAALIPDAIPISTVAFDPNRALELALGGGDDYQLLFSASLEHSDRIRALAKETLTPVRCIGTVTADLFVGWQDGSTLPPALFSHFGGS